MFLIDDISISASITGFENPTVPYLDKEINLDESLILSKSSTRLIHSPNSILRRGISKDDWLIVNSSMTPKSNDIVIAYANDTMGATTLSYLNSCSKDYDITILGVVQQSVHFYRSTPSIPDHENLNCISIHDLLVEKDYATVIAKADGESMKPHVFTGDLMLIERHLDAQDGDVCVVALNGDLVLKRINRAGGTLSSDNPAYATVKIKADDRVSLEGVVNKIIRMHTPLCIA